MFFCIFFLIKNANKQRAKESKNESSVLGSIYTEVSYFTSEGSKLMILTSAKSVSMWKRCKLINSRVSLARWCARVPCASVTATPPHPFPSLLSQLQHKQVSANFVHTNNIFVFRFLENKPNLLKNLS